MKTLSLIRYTAWAAIAALAILAGVVLFGPRHGGSGVVSATIGGPFVLASTQGTALDSKTLKGRPYAMFFGFTHCPDVCPTTMFELSQDMKKLDGDAALAAKARDFRVYFVTVDPERDTAALLKEYLSAFDPRIIGLIPKDQAELERTAKAYHVFFEKVPTKDGYTMNHSASVFLFDAAGNWAGTLDTQESEAARLSKLKRLLGAGAGA